jgi:hypothetical protein
MSKLGSRVQILDAGHLSRESVFRYARPGLELKPLRTRWKGRQTDEDLLSTVFMICVTRLRLV